MDPVTKGWQYYVMDSEHTPRVSIIVRTKDRPQLLRRALSSIAEQSFTNWEAIVVNDGGDPKTVESVIGELPPSVSQRVRHVHHSESLGRWPSANAGIARSVASLVVLHDDDDSWHPDFLAETVSFLDAAPEEYGVVARTEVILEEECDGEFIESGRYVLEAHNEEILLTDLLSFNRFVPIGFVYRRQLHDVIGPYNESLPAAGDWAFNLAVVSLQPIRYVSDRPLAYWHQRPGTRGVIGNSVHAAVDDHAFANRLYRDQQLRAYAQTEGLGVPLYASAVVADVTNRIDGLTSAITQLQTRLNDLETQNDRLAARADLILHNLSRTIDTRIRGWVVRQKNRLRRSR